MKALADEELGGVMRPARSLAITFIAVAGLFVAPLAGAAQSCASLSKFSMPQDRVVIRQTQDVAASAPGVSPAVPAHCRVDGVIDERTGRDGKSYGIGFAVALPVNWNGRFLFQGAAD
jgi:feruloyl esterase